MSKYNRENYKVGDIAEVVIKTGVRQEPLARYTGMVVETGDVFLKIKDPGRRFLVVTKYDDIQTSKIIRSKGDKTQRDAAAELISSLGYIDGTSGEWNCKWISACNAFMVYRLRKIADFAVDAFNESDAWDGEEIARLSSSAPCVELAPNYVNMTCYKKWIEAQSLPPVYFNAAIIEDEIERIPVFRKDASQSVEETELWIFECSTATYNGSLTGNGYDDIMRAVKVNN